MSHKDNKLDDILSAADPCKVFIGGISDRDSEEDVGDFFSQWGLVILVYRDRSWGFVTFATKEAALRLLDERTVVYHRNRLEIKALCLLRTQACNWVWDDWDDRDSSGICDIPCLGLFTPIPL